MTTMTEDRERVRFQPTWTVVHTKPRCEETAERHLDQLGYETFLPKSRLRSGDPVRPHFPRYLFVNVEGREWAPMFRAVGVDYVLRGADGTAIAIVPTDVVEYLKAQHAAGIVIRRRPQKGDRVAVVAGPFTGCEALVAGETNHRVKLLLDIAGNAVAFSVPVDAVIGR